MEDTQVLDTQAQEVTQEPVKTESPETQEALDWSKDKRFSNYTGKADQAVSEMYKMLKGYDKTYTPMQMAIKKYGIEDHKSLETALEEYKRLKDPENDTNKFINYLNPVLSDENDIQWFKETVEKKLQEIKFRGLDQNLPPEYKQAILDGREAKAQLAAMQEKLEVKEILGKMESSLSEIKTYAEKNNLDFNRDEFIKYCKDKNVPSHLMMDVFEAKAKPFVINNETRKAEEKLLQNQAANRKGGIVIGNKGTVSTPSKGNFMQGLDAILNR